MSSFIALTRDRDTGSVAPDPDTGIPRVDYTPSDFDRDHTLEGVQALAKMCYVTGATEIFPHFPGLESFVPSRGGEDDATETGTTNGQGKNEKTADPEFSDPAFAKWLQRVREVGNKPPITMWSSAHQMGTCRMSAKAEDGVVDDRGKVWGRDGLYVADASVFPSASGVNPMITVMAVSDWISRCVVEDLGKQKGA